MQVLDVLKGVDRLLSIGAELAGETPFGVVLGIVDTGIKSAILFAEAGKDPAVEITRIHDADPELQKMRSEWEDRIKQKFGDG